MSDQKRVFIIHGWGGNPGEAWLPWLANNLKEKGFSVEVPNMPDTDNPKIEAWTEHIRTVVGECDENTFFVGHSIGCQAIMRYLEKISDDEQAGGAVFVAPWLTLTGLKEEEERIVSSPWLNLPIDFKKIKKHTEKFICIFSDNDPYVPKENWDMFSKELGAETIIEKNKGHFTEDDGVKEFLTVFEAVLRIAMK
jgi:predicted alpha/beta hydrolase family esterase